MVKLGQQQRLPTVERLHNLGDKNIGIARHLGVSGATIKRDLEWLGIPRWDDDVTDEEIDVMALHAVVHLHRSIGIKSVKGHMRSWFGKQIQRGRVRASLVRLSLLRKPSRRVRRRSYFNSVGKDNVWCAWAFRCVSLKELITY
jgi:hypothetical protein